MTLQSFMRMESGSGGDSAPSGQKDLKSIVANVGRIVKDVKTGVSKKAGVVGINFGISALLKQSQLFTGFVGSIFQIVGGLIDILLAPFMPYAFKVLGYVSKIIPIIQEKLTAFTEWIGGIWEASDGIGDFLGNLATESYAVLVNALGELWDKISNYDWGALITKIWEKITEWTSSVLTGIGNAFPWLQDEMDLLAIAGGNLEKELSLFKNDADDNAGEQASLLSKFWSSVTTDIESFGMVIGFAFKLITETAVNFITKWVNYGAFLGKWVREFWDYLKLLGTDIVSAWNWVKTFVTGGFNEAIVNGVQNGVYALTEFVSNIWDWLGGVVEKISSAATTVLNAILDPIKALIQNIGAIVETIGNPGKAIGGLFDRAKEGLGGMFGGGGGGSLDIKINGTSLSPQEMAEGRAAVRGNINGQSEYSANQLMFDGGYN